MTSELAREPRVWERIRACGSPVRARLLRCGRGTSSAGACTRRRCVRRVGGTGYLDLSEETLIDLWIISAHYGTVVRS